MTTDGPKSGHDKPLCGADRRQGEPGATCTRPAGWGTDHVGIGRCKLHGGATPSHLRAAQVEMAAAAVVTFGLPREIDPSAALLEEVHRAAGAVAWLDLQVRELGLDEVTWGRIEDKATTAGAFPGTTTIERAAINIWVALWQSERDRLVRVSAEAIKCGIAERQVRLAEQQGALMAEIVRTALADPRLGQVPSDVQAAIARDAFKVIGGVA